MNLGALKSTNFRAYVFGSAFGLLAIWMQRITIGWLAWEMTESATMVGAVAFFLFAPSIVLSPLFGVWVDRMNVKRAVVVVQSLNAALSAALWYFVASGTASPFMLALFSLLFGVVMAANHPVRMALTPRLVRREFVGSVVTIVAINFNVARMIGPAIGGFLISQVGVAHTLLIQWLLFLPYIVVLFRLSLRPRRETGSAQEPFFQALGAGLKFVWKTVPVREAMFVAGVLALVARGAMEVLPPLADGVFGKGASGLGILMSVTGAGSILGGFSQAVMAPQEPGRLPLTTRLSIVLGLALVVGLGVTPTWETALFVAAAMSFVTTVTAISTQTAIQLDLEDDMRGRVMSLWAVIAAGGSALGAALIGAMADAIGLQKALIMMGSASTLLVGGYLVFMHYRRLAKERGFGG
ncbi:putative MFS family arabinose efflux permease [Shimia isoporae]|uniref:Putative MFS family arabinose efflux permease n=1 Tax=Shimia isoporae TaxID=647720 RepID=A0A4R1NCG5_9RHOB|nr:MFS transporter [Shimia isoporae]TCL01333.1 putative MFS family arabinose efflux permease [Shimia isoporae]